MKHVGSSLCGHHVVVLICSSSVMAVSMLDKIASKTGGVIHVGLLFVL